MMAQTNKQTKEVGTLLYKEIMDGFATLIKPYYIIYNHKYWSNGGYMSNMVVGHTAYNYHSI